MAQHNSVVPTTVFSVEDAIVGKLPWRWYGTTALDGTAGPWKDAQLGSEYTLNSSNVVTKYVKTANNQATADWRVLTGVNSRTGHVGVPLTTLRKVHSNDLGENVYRNRRVSVSIPLQTLREVASNDIPANAATPPGGILTKDTTPNLEFANGDTDSQLRLEWAAGNSDAVTFNYAFPRDMDLSEDITIQIRGESAGTTNVTTVMTIESFFNEGDTKISDTSNAFTAAVVNTVTTIAAADIGLVDGAALGTASFEMTLGAHATDAIYVYAITLEYFVSSTNPSLAYANGDTDSSPVLTWAAAEVGPVWFSTPLPPNFDDASNLEIHFRAKAGGSTDTITVTAESYFDEADTKVTDTTTVSGTTWTEKTITVAAADFPASQFVSVELTPGTHGTDSLVLSSLWLEFTLT